MYLPCHFIYHLQFVVCAILTLSLPHVIDGKPLHVYEFCLWMCDHLFGFCLQDECPNRTWPLPVTAKCVKKRSDCIDRCEPFEHLRL
ncbi:hypothetical protein NP493_204g04002 [Ridgeia piscesae]|uniref:Secreted protein n=1 Tax=Ridgeia piscesae TaxID=27915 RepID=A0AAD9P0T2_RIDPI|nr:hypothetical protein NP493_204g04002 [Ridgeia piscesae]